MKNNDIIEAMLNSTMTSDRLLAIHFQYKDIDESKLRKKIQVEYNKAISKEERVIMLDNISFYVYYSKSKKIKSYINILIRHHSYKAVDINSHDKNTILNFIYSFLKNELDE